MGLDMYLTGERYLWDEKDVALQDTIKKAFNTDLTPKRIVFEIHYWRKANAIHKWFVENVQGGEDDCGNYYVSKEQLQQLLELVTQALAAPKPEVLLPTRGGFFFGTTEYDDDYKQDLRDTKVGLEKFLGSKEAKQMDVHYQSSW